MKSTPASPFAGHPTSCHCKGEFEGLPTQHASYPGAVVCEPLSAISRCSTRPLDDVQRHTLISALATLVLQTAPPSLALTDSVRRTGRLCTRAHSGAQHPQHRYSVQPQHVRSAAILVRDVGLPVRIGPAAIVHQHRGRRIPWRTGATVPRPVQRVPAVVVHNRLGAAGPVDLLRRQQCWGGWQLRVGQRVGRARHVAGDAAVHGPR